MKKLWKYMRDYRREGILAPLFKLLEASLELLVPLVMAQIIDIGIANGDGGFILSRCGILAVLAAVGLVCSITAQYFAAKASVGFAAKLRSTLFKHIQSLSYSKLDTQGTGTLIARITGDINQVQSGMNLALRLLLRSPFVVFGAMIMAFTIDVKAALVFVVTIPLLSIVVFGIMLWSIPMYKKVQAKNEVLEREIPQLQEIAGKVWKKEDELKQLKSELAALDRKIQLELTPPTPEISRQAENGQQMQDSHGEKMIQMKQSHSDRSPTNEISFSSCSQNSCITSAPKEPMSENKCSFGKFRL